MWLDDLIDVEYIGDPPMLDEVIRLRIAMGEIPWEASTVMRAAEATRMTAIQGIDKRIVDREHFDSRLSRDYVFGPSSFIVAVHKKDLDIIKDSSDAHQFRIVGEIATEIIRPSPNIHLVSEVEGVDLRSVGI